jgi:FAD binding domain
MTQSDLALAFHRVFPRVYELSGLRTGSVRDQMVRAVLVVERLHAAKIIGQDRPLLIVGAGAAGMCAALTASELNVRSLVLERTTSVLTTQQSVTSRVIDPTEYDWPHPHWKEGKFPFRPDDQPLPVEFFRGTADAIAWEWQLDFHNWCTTVVRLNSSGYAAIQIKHEWQARQNPANQNIECFDLTTDPATAVGEVKWTDHCVYFTDKAGTAFPDKFGAALSCIGFGDERVEATSTGGSTFAGPPFWAEDKFENRDLGLPVTGGRRDVLVSGGGDGAQQDIQRLLTRRCGRDLVEAMSEVSPGFMDHVDIGEVALADDEGRRSHAWAPAHKRPATSLARWHDAFTKQADHIWSHWSEDIQHEMVSRVLRESVSVHLTWILGHDVPSFSFGINRLLTHLVLKMHELQTSRPLRTDEAPDKWNGERPIIVAGLKLGRVDPVNHSCSGYESCLGKIHTAYCVVGSKELPLGEFDIVVIRHGMDVKPLFGTPPVPEQVTPLSFPE